MTKTCYYTCFPSPVGEIMLTADEIGLTGVFMEDHGKDFGRPVPLDPNAVRDDDVLARARNQLEEYFAGERTDFDLDLSVNGTAFQEKVWSELRRIPYGETMTYSELAHRIGHPKAVRAVGSANSRNPIGIIVPCHRVIGRDGTLTGYAGGLPRKRWLLQHENHLFRSAVNSGA